MSIFRRNENGHSSGGSYADTYDAKLLTTDEAIDELHFLSSMGLIGAEVEHGPFTPKLPSVDVLDLIEGEA